MQIGRWAIAFSQFIPGGALVEDPRGAFLIDPSSAVSSFACRITGGAGACTVFLRFGFSPTIPIRVGGRENPGINFAVLPAPGAFEFASPPHEINPPLPVPSLAGSRFSLMAPWARVFVSKSGPSGNYVLEVLKAEAIL